MPKIFRYYVEGQCEKHFLDTYKSGPAPVFKSGKVEVFNVMNERITQTRLINFSKNTVLVLIFDTDIEPTDVFKHNLSLLRKNKNISEIIYVPSIRNFEEELVYSSDINDINEMFKTKGLKEFKTKFNSSNIVPRMSKINFSFQKIWSRVPQKPFSKYKQQGYQIKQKCDKW